MESAAAWGPCESELANWSLEEPAAGIPVENGAWSIDMFDTCSIQAYVPEFYCGQQQVEYNYYSAASQSTIPSNKARGSAEPTGLHTGRPTESSDDEFEDMENGQKKISEATETTLPSNRGQGSREPTGEHSDRPTKTSDREEPAVDLKKGQKKIPETIGCSMIKQVVSKFKDHIDMMKEKMHRYPACLADVDKSYKEPMIVAIGPYHRELPVVKNAEKVKHAAACHCATESVPLLQEMYAKVASVADQVWYLYDKDEMMADISCQDFRDMMFIDACFLVQFMRSMWRKKKGGESETIDPSLQGFMGPNSAVILRDVLLLDNQIPWQVVETVMSFPSAGGPSPTDVPRKFVSSLINFLQDDKLSSDKRPILQWDQHYKPPHLLGLLRHYIVGRSSSSKSSSSSSSSSSNNDTNDNAKARDKQRTKKRSVSASAVELAEIGISLTPNKDRMELIPMGLSQGIVFAELCLTPFSLNCDRGSYLISMAALEICMVKSFGDAPEEDSAVCSYLLLLAMLAYRVEDVHELRERGLLQGGGGLTNEEALRFFTSLQGLRLGKCYTRVMQEIEKYKENWQVPAYKLFYKNKKTIATVVSGIGALGTIIGTLKSIKTAL